MPRIGQIEIPTLKDLFIEKIEDLIITGKLAVGERLPTERELEEETHISKTVIHQGLVDLETKGFVEIVPRKGTFVANFAETGTLETLNAQLRHNGGTITKKQMDSLFEARMAVEGAAIRKLALNHSAEDITTLKQIVDKAEDFATGKEGKDFSKLAELFFCFNRSICSLCGNLMFPLILNDFKPIFLAFWEFSLKTFGVEKNLHLLRRFIDEIAAGDADAAYARLEKSAKTSLKHYDLS